MGGEDCPPPPPHLLLGCPSTAAPATPFSDRSSPSSCFPSSSVVVPRKALLYAPNFWREALKIFLPPPKRPQSGPFKAPPQLSKTCDPPFPGSQMNLPRWTAVCEPKSSGRVSQRLLQFQMQNDVRLLVWNISRRIYRERGELGNVNLLFNVLTDLKKMQNTDCLMFRTIC